MLQLTSGFDAMDALLGQSGLLLSDFDRTEFMEAFAAPPLKFERDYAPDMDRVNPEGGHLAMGHPMGASGAILAATALSGARSSGWCAGPGRHPWRVRRRRGDGDRTALVVWFVSSHFQIAAAAMTAPDRHRSLPIGKLGRHPARWIDGCDLHIQRA